MCIRDSGVNLKDGKTRPAQARLIPQPDGLWPRTPPVRERQSIPTSWIELTIKEGKNRQVRRMTAAVGHPTLRLIRAQIGEWPLGALQPGEHSQLAVDTPPPAVKKTISKRQKPFRKIRRAK